MSNKLLEIKDLCVKMQEKEVLKGFGITINEGEVHCIMGLNGAGKSTLSKAITGHYECDVISGEILYKNKNMLDLTPEDRANEGIFMSFQNPIEIPGVNNMYFLRSILNAKRKYLGLEELSSIDVLKKIRKITKEANIPEDMLKRFVNDGFSGGEKKKNELLQMLLLEPDFIILDEIDSGLDIDALKLVSNGVNSLRNDKRSFLIITHYQRLLGFIKPDFIHILKDGKIIKTGDYTLALELEEKGYEIVGV
jgi:Fe-S cluster assembly ATP-binding protein